MEKQNQPDPPIDESQEIRQAISARFGHDPAKLVDFYMEYQKELHDRLLSTREAAAKKGKDGKSAA
jgi:uncharacterized protein YeaO (DUF488 family)